LDSDCGLRIEGEEIEKEEEEGEIEEGESELRKKEMAGGGNMDLVPHCWYCCVFVVSDMVECLGE